MTNSISQPGNPSPIPEGYTTVTPWIISEDSAKLIKFLETAFDAEEIEGSRVQNEDGSIGHVEVRIGDAIVMLFDSKKSWPETPIFLRLYVEDSEQTYQKALVAGAIPITKVTPMVWGDKVGRVKDPFDNIWWIQERVEVIDDYEELQKRMEKPQAIEAMNYVQGSLDKELKNGAIKNS